MFWWPALIPRLRFVVALMIRPESTTLPLAKKFLKYWASQEIRSVYVEGGASVHGAFHDAALKDHRLIDRVIFYIAPKIICGKNSLSSVGGKGVIELNEVLKLKRVKMENCGADFKCSGFLNFY